MTINPKLLNSEAARDLWCPFARVLVSGDGEAANGNRQMDGKPLRGSRCLGMSCMAWRWAGEQHEQLGFLGVSDPDDDDEEEPLGYCGLAGRIS